MSGSENTPPMFFGAPRDAEACPVLICAGQAASKIPTDGIRAIEIDLALEVGRGPSTTAGQIPRLETGDPHMSRNHALLRRINSTTVVLRDLGSRNGIIVNGKPMMGDIVLDDGAVLFIGAHVFVYRLMSREDLDAVTIAFSNPFGPVPTMSPVVARISERLRRLARSDVDLLLGGETGVGKEVMAKAIHQESGRSGPLVTINCAALPDALLESELFGYARGAHSMAEHSKPGLIEQAEGGTLFLDEIGDMSQAAQSKLLRFLQDGFVLPLGATRPRRLDVRVVAATRRAVAVTDGALGIRFDLAARLGPEAITIPPLRARIEDIGLLVRYFLRDSPWSFDIRSYRSLYLHLWPGNVRELEKTLRFAVVLSEGRTEIDRAALALTSGGEATLPEIPQQPSQLERRASVYGGPRGARPTPDLLAALLEQHRGNVADVARELQRQRTLVWRWVRNAGLDPARFRDAPTENTPPPV